MKHVVALSLLEVVLVGIAGLHDQDLACPEFELLIVEAALVGALFRQDPLVVGMAVTGVLAVLQHAQAVEIVKDRVEGRGAFRMAGAPVPLLEDGLHGDSGFDCRNGYASAGMNMVPHVKGRNTSIRRFR
jgi:hypothetical protein